MTFKYRYRNVAIKWKYPSCNLEDEMKVDHLWFYPRLEMVHFSKIGNMYL